MTDPTPCPAPRPTHRRATVLEASTPEDLLAAVPVVLGFEPVDSVVMLTFGGAETFHARLDLPPPAEADGAAEMLLEPAVLHGVRRALFVLYCADGPSGRAARRALQETFGRAGIEVVEVLRAHQGRWWASGRDAPPGGVPYDLGGHRFRAQAVVDGIVVHGSRSDLERLLLARPEAATETARAVRRALPSPPGEIADLVSMRLEAGRFAPAELARVLLGLLETSGRDAAWAAMTRATSLAHVRLWTDAVQRTPDDLVAAPAAVLAMAAWLAGQGALAWCAVDRCRAGDPDNSLARLVADVLTRAVPPSVWDQAAEPHAGPRSAFEVLGSPHG